MTSVLASQIPNELCQTDGINTLISAGLSSEPMKHLKRFKLHRCLVQFSRMLKKMFPIIPASVDTTRFQEQVGKWRVPPLNHFVLPSVSR